MHGADGAGIAIVRYIGQAVGLCLVQHAIHRNNTDGGVATRRRDTNLLRGRRVAVQQAFRRYSGTVWHMRAGNTLPRFGMIHIAHGIDRHHRPHRYTLRQCHRGAANAAGLRDSGLYQLAHGSPGASAVASLLHPFAG